MAAPASKTIGDLTGKWVMSKTLSDNPEPGLALQGIGYLTRKAIGLTTVTLHTKQYTEGEFVHIDIEQTATAGIKGTTENRTIDGVSRPHSDWLFGSVSARSTWADADELVKIAAEHGAFLGAGWLEDDEEKKGPNGATHVVNYVNADAGWTAVQVWGFQTIGGERRHARKIILKKGEKTVELRLVYDFTPED